MGAFRKKSGQTLARFANGGRGAAPFGRADERAPERKKVPRQPD